MLPCVSLSGLADVDDLVLGVFALVVTVPGERLQLVRDALAGDLQRLGDVLERGPELAGPEEGLGLHGIEVGAELGERLQGDQRERFHVLELAKQGTPGVGHVGEHTGGGCKSQGHAAAGDLAYSIIASADIRVWARIARRV